MEYSFWRVWGTTYEGDRRWFMVRTPDDWDSDMVLEHARDVLGRQGGVGPDMCEADEVEYGYDDGVWTDYSE